MAENGHKPGVTHSSAPAVSHIEMLGLRLSPVCRAGRSTVSTTQLAQINITAGLGDLLIHNIISSDK